MTELARIKPSCFEGNEPFRFGDVATAFAVRDSWRWSSSDLVSNATRGLLAEFVVAKALGGDTATPRAEWVPYDLLSPDGTKVEVKSAGLLADLGHNMSCRLYNSVSGRPGTGTRTPARAAAFRAVPRTSTFSPSWPIGTRQRLTRFN